MEKRIAYIGLACPLFYDYKNTTARTKNDINSSPNPILESPFGLMLLYDELWFLCKSLCPQNMRELPYVKYVDELFAIDFSQLIDLEQVESFEKALTNEMSSEYDFKDLQKHLKIRRSQYNLDSHTHTLHIGNIEISAAPKIKRLLFDLNVVSMIDQEVEIITNSYTNQFIANNSNLHNDLTELLTIKDIPNYMTIKGPYHPVVDEAREDKYLSAFRKWIISEHRSIDKNEIIDICTEVENSIHEKQNELFLKWLDPMTSYKSIGETLIMNAAGIVLPIVPMIKDAISIGTDISTLAKNKNKLWQGFIVNSQYKYFK